MIFLVTYEPIYGYFDYQKFKAKVRLNSNERVSYYKKVMAGLWIPALLILSLIGFGPLTLKDIGLSGIHVDPAPLGKWVTYLSFGLGIGYVLGLLYYLIGSKVSQKVKREMVKIQKQQIEKTTFADIMPKTIEDRKMWTYVSWTAGITEEMIYRGFSIFALSQLFPDVSLWIILVASSVLFGLAHTYQGVSNVVRTSLVGLFFALIYIGLNSIIPLIVLHFLIDYVGKIGDTEDIMNQEKTG
ncbi:CPBP family intramembrane glutamic endopeptidase [Neobacillus sp. Marseille-QA0830]